MVEYLSKIKQIINCCSKSFKLKPDKRVLDAGKNFSFTNRLGEVGAKQLHLRTAKRNEEISEYFYEFICQSVNVSSPVGKVQKSLRAQASIYEKFCRSLNSRIKTIQDHSGRVLGGYSSNVQGQNLNISSLYLTPEAKTKSLVLDLFQDIKSSALQSGCSEIVCVSHNGLVGLYEKLGFRVNKPKGIKGIWNMVTGNREMSCPVQDFAKRYL